MKTINSPIVLIAVFSLSFLSSFSQNLFDPFDNLNGWSKAGQLLRNNEPPQDVEVYPTASDGIAHLGTSFLKSYSQGQRYTGILYKNFSFEVGKTYNIKTRVELIKYNVSQSCGEGKTELYIRAGNYFSIAALPPVSGGEILTKSFIGGTYYWMSGSSWTEVDIFFTPQENFSLIGISTFTQGCTLYSDVQTAELYFNFDYIQLCEAPAKPTISGNGVGCTNGISELTATSGGSSYKWYFTDNLNTAPTLEPTTSQSIVISKTGYYSVQLVNENGCASSRSDWRETIAYTPSFPQISGANICAPENTTILNAPEYGYAFKMVFSN